MADLQHSVERNFNVSSGRGMTVVVVSPLIGKTSRECVRAARIDNPSAVVKIGSRRRVTVV